MLTVLMASHNGAAWLRQSLESYLALRPPTGGWKMVAVDSASTDETRAILAEFAERLPLEVIHVDRPGKNVALNLGLQRAEGELLVFTDDDVVVDPEWLVELEAAAAAEPDHAIFGGAIRPVWPRRPEPWVNEVPLGLTYTVTPDWERGPCDPHSVWGPNMAIRTGLFRAGLRFDERIGPNGTATYAMGSETSLTRRLAARGHRCFHVPGAVVGHIIRPQQMTRGFAMRRAYRGGRGKGVLAGEFERVATFGPIPRYFVGEAARAACRYAAATLLGRRRHAVQAAWRWNFALGCIDGALSVAKPVFPVRLAAAPSHGVPAPA